MPDTEARKIRVALASHPAGNLRAWSFAWAQQQGSADGGPAAYELAKATIRRRLGRGLPPTGALGAALIRDLYADLNLPLPYPHTDQPAALPAGTDLTTEARQIISALGGTQAAAAALNESVLTIGQWRRRGIPADHLHRARAIVHANTPERRRGRPDRRQGEG